MGMPRRLLTDRFCAHAKAIPGDVQTDYFDEATKGLALRVSRSGSKSWTLHHTANGKRARLTFGNYPAISLGAARAKADEARTLGPDAIAKADSFEAICKEYITREGGKLRTAEWRQAVLERLVYPALGSKPISDIRRSDIVRLLDQIEDENGPVMATKTLAVIRKIMNWYASRSDDFRSPIVRGMARGTGVARDRILTDDELREIWLASEGSVEGSYVRFLLLTAARRSEVAGMEWTELALGDWTLPAARNKTNQDLLRPLSQAALACLPQRDGKWVFVNRLGTGPLIDFDRVKTKLDEASGVTGWTLHDLRRTARSLMSRAGVTTDHAERCLGHTIAGVRGVYDRHEYHAEKKQAYEALAGIIERIVTGAQAGVVQLKRKQ
jgi:integrase